MCWHAHNKTSLWSNMLIKNIQEKGKVGIAEHKLPVFVEKKKVVKKKPDRALNLEKQLNEALKIIDELEETLEVEREERFQAGFASGKQEGYKEGLNEINSQIQKMAETVSVIKKHQQEYIQSAESFVVEFAIRMVEEMVDSGFLEKHGISVKKISEYVSNAMDKFSDSTRYVFRVHAETLPIMQEYLEKIKQEFKEKTIISVVEGPSLAPGDCLIETDYGALDGTIKTHFREILNAVKEGQD